MEGVDVVEAVDVVEPSAGVGKEIKQNIHCVLGTFKDHEVSI